MENWAKIFQKKKIHKTCSKHVWILLGTLLGIFGILKIFFFKIFENSTLHGTLGKKKFSKNLPQNRFKARLDIFGNDFGHFWNFEKKISKFLKTRPSMEHWALFFFRKNHPKTRLDSFGNTFGHFCNFENVFFLKIFVESTFHGKLGKNFPKSLPQNMCKTCLHTFGNDFRHFWNFEIFFDFFGNFRRLDPPWNTGH